ncbi:family 43 glycosylhydrolase [Flavobacteriaceae bacterium TP-CH-4]|uniref:Family 43 glycosylhydrolase n=1 Tax=Pelagihabitans pacificus TaxID=2696054 RepID=A0A967APW1_9FLAO|nr:family 43 glycosylhydrolase [Pelagihabitans pacificus]NHF58154.1 family 43 glycosylhydrolase [Pelagihabitans pacificus]
MGLTSLPTTLLFFFALAAYGQTLQIDNTLPKLDEQGAVVDAHDGRVIQFGNRFYWYGTAYGNTNGFTHKNTYYCYSSKNLTDWKKEGKLLENQPIGVYYRPHVIYNQKTQKYVLWYNWYPKLWEGRFGVATSDTPTGPFKIVNDNVRMVRSKVGLGDFGLFVDDDQTAYISYNTIQNHQVSIEKLSDDYLSSSMQNGGIIAEHMEAGSQFKRNGKYYLLTDHTCCFCNYGSGARVYISENPMTDYVYTGNINRYPGTPSLVLNDGVLTGTKYETLTKTKEGFHHLETVLKEPSEISGIEIHLFTGNRPENCGDVNNPRVHPEIVTPKFEISHWNNGQWKATEPVSLEIIQSALKEKALISFSKINTDRLRISLGNDYVYDHAYVNEVKLLKNATDDTTIPATSYLTGKDIPQRPIIPAQQTYVMTLNTANGEQFIWMGDLWGSASDNTKGHDYQYWSDPLRFNADGTIQPLKWVDSWQATLR